MRAKGVAPDAACLQGLLLSLCNAGALSDALALLEET